jgi:hypothetical protein
MLIVNWVIHESVWESSYIAKAEAGPRHRMIAESLIEYVPNSNAPVVMYIDIEGMHQ